MARCQVHILLMFLFESGFNSQMILQQIRLFLKYCTFPPKCCSFGFPIAFTFPQFAQFPQFFHSRPVLVIFYRSTDNNLQLGGSFGYRFNFFPTTGNNSHPGDSFGYNYNRGWAGLPPERNTIWLTADFHLRCRLLDQPLRLPQVLIKPRKILSSSSVVHWRRPAELG